MPDNDRFFLDDISGVAFADDPRLKKHKPGRKNSPLWRLSATVQQLRQRGRHDLADRLIAEHGKRGQQR